MANAWPTCVQGCHLCLLKRQYYPPLPRRGFVKLVSSVLSRILVPTWCEMIVFLSNLWRLIHWSRLGTNRWSCGTNLPLIDIRWWLIGTISRNHWFLCPSMAMCMLLTIVSECASGLGSHSPDLMSLSLCHNTLTAEQVYAVDNASTF